MIRGAFAAVIVGCASATLVAPSSPSFNIANDQFMKDGKPFQIKAGCIHYSRVPPEYWNDRILRLKAMGLNAIQTYVPWNWHEPTQGKYDFASPGRNLTQFILTAQKLDMMVVLRAGPYMCGEWEYGGLPAWILQNGAIKLRTYAEPYISYVNKWWGEGLLPVVKPLLYSNGGPVVMVQVENEYGSYGDVSTNPLDMQYLKSLIALARTSLGDDVVLFTTDGGDEGYMTRGSIKGGSVYTVGDGCGSPQGCIDAQKAFNPPGMSPFMCSECYTGWLTHWGEGGANSSSSAGHVESIIGQYQGSISLYMGHGGTNFGYWSGANGGGGSSYQPHETSYDYNSPVAEAGEHGYHGGVDKFAAMQAVLQKHATVPNTPEPPLLPRTAYGAVTMTSSAPVLANIPKLATSSHAGLLSMESISCPYGFLAYTTKLSAAAAGDLTFTGLKDRAQVFVDGVLQGTSYRVNKAPPVTIAAKVGSILTILLENMGRINFSHGMDDEVKGIATITLNGQNVSAYSSWTTQCLPFTATEIAAATFAPVTAPASTSGYPTLYKGTFTISGAASDTFLKMDGWTKGIAWVNGFNLGRYWQPVGPQQTLYVPAPRLTTGVNTLVVLELGNTSSDLTTEFVGQPELQMPPPNKPGKCDPTMPPVAGALVNMVSESPKTAHQQQWTMNSDGTIALKAMPHLCFTVTTGCPHAASGCTTVETCKGLSGQVFDLKPDPSQAGSHRLVQRSNQNCVDIYGHDDFEGSPIDMWECYGPGESNQRWKYDTVMGHIASEQAGTLATPLVFTVCAAKKAGGAGGVGVAAAEQ